jgi:hypothetical protein
MPAFSEEINALLMHLLEQGNMVGSQRFDALDMVDRHDQDMCLCCRVDVIECCNLIVLLG